MNERTKIPASARWLASELDLNAIEDSALFESLEGFSDRIKAVADLLLSAGDGNFADGTMGMLSELLGEHADQLSTLASMARAQRKTGPVQGEAKSGGTVSVDRNAMMGRLSTAYRSIRQLRQIAAVSVADEYRQKDIDRSWLYEAAGELDLRGYSAMMDAAQLLGVDDEDALARFTDADAVDEDAAEALAGRNGGGR